MQHLEAINQILTAVIITETLALTFIVLVLVLSYMLPRWIEQLLLHE
jgi:hypothetical protein